MPHTPETGEELPWPTKEDLRQWLNEELARLMRESSIRAKEATSLVTDFLTDRITAEEVGKRYGTYSRTWGEALNGLSELEERKTDKEVVQKLLSERETLQDSLRRRSKEGREGPSR